MIIVDVETSGINPEKNSILSIGAVDFSNPENQFYGECCMWEGAEVEEGDGKGVNGALDVNGFTREEIYDKTKSSEKQLLEKFFTWVQTCEEQTFAGQNPFFDNEFISSAAKRANLSWWMWDRLIDLHTLGYTHYLKRGLTPPLRNKKTSVRLDSILAYVGLPEEPKPHNGLIGAKVEAEAFSRLLFSKNLLKDFTQYPLPEYL